ncbi:MAG: lipopolysaccharide biosynthesis protein [Hungatella sp.]|jgi:O-antigen/teichoic acid export membrane protein|nr:lipopolysaccharide biosynthesis protein [Hungatella sp.]
MEDIKRLAKTTIVYFLGTVGTKLISFLLLPLYTSYLMPREYGRYDVNITYATLFASVCFLDIWTGIMKYMFEEKGEEGQLKFVYSGIAIFLTSSLVYAAALSCFEAVLGIEYPAGVMAYGFFLCFQNLYGYLARAYGKNQLFICSGLISTACNALLNILLLAYFGWDYKALYLSYALGILIQCAILEWKLRLIPHFKKEYLDKESIRHLLRFSLPLCINSLCYWLLTGYNRIIIEKEVDAAANGYYAVASKFGGILILVSSCFSMAWQELAYRKYDKDKSTGQFYSYATSLYIKVLFEGFFVILPMVYLLFPYLVDPGYDAAKPMVPVNMLATLAGILFIFLGNIMSTYKKNNIVFLSTLAASIVNLMILHTLIPRFGAEAANIALLTGYVVSDMIRIYMIGREITYRLDWKMFQYLIPFTGMVLLGYWNGQKEDNLVLILVGFVVCVWTMWPDIEPFVKSLQGRFRKTSLEPPDTLC